MQATIGFLHLILTSACLWGSRRIYFTRYIQSKSALVPMHAVFRAQDIAPLYFPRWEMPLNSFGIEVFVFEVGYCTEL